MRFKPLLAAALLLMSIPCLSQAQTALRDRPEVADALKVFDLWIEQFVAYRDIPGLSIAIVHDQEIVWAKGYGFADLKTKTPATPSTVYRLGSITKLFTASAIMKLRDEGKLRLDNPVGSYLPWFHVSNPFPDEPQITVRELLTHTSGLPREAPFPYWTDHIFPTQAQFQAAEGHQEVLYPPDTTYHYSNLGMALLGAIVAEVSGRPWAEYVDEEILRPLGMTSSSGAPDKELLSRRATSYMMPGPDGDRGTFPYY
ncbi:MAG: serine hydrolase, partial [Acidobacteriota bacterium]